MKKFMICFSLALFILSGVSCKKAHKKDEDPGITWLQQYKDEAEIQVNGTWNSKEWGSVIFFQEDGKSNIKGKLADYDIVGKVSGTSIYIILYYSGKIYYSMKLAPLGKNQIIGEYSKGLMSASTPRYPVSIDPVGTETIKTLSKQGGASIAGGSKKNEGLLTFNIKLIDIKTAAIDSSVTKEVNNAKELKALSKEMVQELIKDFAAPAKKDRVAIVPSVKNKTLNRMLLYVEDLIVASKLFVVIERSAIDKILKEQEFSHSAFVDEKQTVAIGKILGANKIVLIKLLEEKD